MPLIVCNNWTVAREVADGKPDVYVFSFWDNAKQSTGYTGKITRELVWLKGKQPADFEEKVTNDGKVSLYDGSKLLREGVDVKTYYSYEHAVRTGLSKVLPSSQFGGWTVANAGITYVFVAARRVTQQIVDEEAKDVKTKDGKPKMKTVYVQSDEELASLFSTSAPAPATTATATVA